MFRLLWDNAGLWTRCCISLLFIDLAAHWKLNFEACFFHEHFWQCVARGCFLGFLCVEKLPFDYVSGPEIIQRAALGDKLEHCFSIWSRETHQVIWYRMLDQLLLVSFIELFFQKRVRGISEFHFWHLNCWCVAWANGAVVWSGNPVSTWVDRHICLRTVHVSLRGEMTGARQQSLNQNLFYSLQKPKHCFQRMAGIELGDISMWYWRQPCVRVLQILPPII